MSELSPRLAGVLCLLARGWYMRITGFGARIRPYADVPERFGVGVWIDLLTIASGMRRGYLRIRWGGWVTLTAAGKAVAVMREEEK